MEEQHGENIKSDTLLELLKVIDRICKENDLRYFAFSNLLVGCVYYKGFIPDSPLNDIAVGLLRDEYEKFIVIVKNEAEKYGVIYRDSYLNTNIKRSVVQIGKEIVLEEENGKTSEFVKVNINVFDVASREFDFRDAYYDRMDRANKRYQKILRAKGCEKSEQNPILFLIDKILYGGRSADKAFKKLNKKAAKYNGRDNMTAVRSVIPKRSKLIFLDQLFPLQKMPFMDMELPCPKDFSPWTVYPDEALMDRIKTIQKVDMMLLKEFDRICRILDIGYFICGGTMLGYVRHGGFIPWDDDIDVGMLRADYDRFLKEAGEYLDERFFLQTRKSDRKIPYLFSKIRMNNTEYITAYNDRRDFHKGICLDLFPFDAIPEGYDNQMRFYRIANKLACIHNRFVNRSIPEPICFGKPECFEDWYYRAKGKLRRFVYKSMPLELTQWIYIKYATKYNDKADRLGLQYVASFVPSYTYIKKEDLLPYRDVRFEGMTVKVPKRPGVFLEMQYGDFMKLPPPHKRLGHKLIRWSANIDFEE